MKKILFTLLFGLITLISNAQIYNTIKYYDKFDDCIKTEKVKTIVSLNDDIITIETKNRKLYFYKVLDFIQVGEQDSVVNLVNNVYGYEGHWYCIELKDTTNWRNENRKKAKELLIKVNPNFSNERIENIINEDSIHCYLPLLGEWIDLMVFCEHKNKYIKLIVERHISSRYFKWDYRDRLFWITKNDGSRIIYSNE